jgi:type IV conjugative transfer system protein TraE
MSVKKYINDYRSAVQNNNVLKLALIVLAAIILIEGIFIIKALNSEKKFVVPNVNGKYVIGVTRANPQYLKSMGTYLSGLVENITPQTISGNYKQFLNYASPGSFGALQASLISNEKAYKRNDAASFFSIKNIKLYPDKITIIGTKRLIIGTNIVSNKILKVILTYKIINGEFEVTGYVEKNISLIN